MVPILNYRSGEFRSMVEIISIGNELLWGYTVNTNGAWLCRELNKRGYPVIRQTTVSDEVNEIQKALKEAMDRSSLIITTGGLGPTIDDRTMEAAGSFFSRKESLANPVGSAPGAYFSSSGKALILLPGPPREMEEMFLQEALPKIERDFPLKTKDRLRRYYLCFLKETEVDPILRSWKKNHPKEEIGIFPSMGSLQIVTSSETLAKEVEKKFPTFFLGEERVEEALHRELIARKKTVALAESMTGGMIGTRLTSIAGSSEFFLGSIVAYSNKWKERFLKVSPATLKKAGAVSRETVEEMIEGLFSETESDYAIAVSGMIGGEVYIGIGERKKKNDIGKIDGPHDRALCIERATQSALSALWRRIVHNKMTFS